jgi:hypothetical protein
LRVGPACDGLRRFCNKAKKRIPIDLMDSAMFASCSVFSAAAPGPWPLALYA